MGECGIAMAGNDGVAGGRGKSDEVGGGGADGAAGGVVGDGSVDGVGGGGIGIVGMMAEQTAEQMVQKN